MLKRKGLHIRAFRFTLKEMARLLLISELYKQPPHFTHMPISNRGKAGREIRIIQEMNKLLKIIIQMRKRQVGLLSNVGLDNKTTLLLRTSIKPIFKKIFKPV